MAKTPRTRLIPSKPREIARVTAKQARPRITPSEPRTISPPSTGKRNRLLPTRAR